MRTATIKWRRNNEQWIKVKKNKTMKQNKIRVIDTWAMKNAAYNTFFSSVCNQLKVLDEKKSDVYYVFEIAECHSIEKSFV